jgi:hypothetical protein
MEEQERYYVLSLTAPGGQGWTSIHRSCEGAQERLNEKVIAWGLEELYAADKLGYGIGHLPVED